jgi:hypothetical protein
MALKLQQFALSRRTTLFEKENSLLKLNQTKRLPSTDSTIQGRRYKFTNYSKLPKERSSQTEEEYQGHSWC